MGVLLPLLLASSAFASEPIHVWRLDREHLKGSTLKPAVGELAGTLSGPARFGEEKPIALLMRGDSEGKERIDLPSAELPTKALTVEAWVKIHRPQEWGGFASMIQDNGGYERGWILGFRNRQFSFGVASEWTKRLTYLSARRNYQTGYWYHVVGTYDGRAQHIYVDGELQGSSMVQQGAILYPPRGFFTLGAYRDDNELYSLAGQMEQVAIFDHALSATEVRSRFRARKELFPDMDVIVPQVTDWPTYLRDSQRTGIASESPVFPLHLQWSYQTRHPPAPAWPEPAKHDYWHKQYDMDARVTYDRAPHVVSVGERLFFASSSEGSVTCLAAITGEMRWTFTTEGPVRCAPTVVGEHLLFGSDDGHVYCLHVRDGSLVWRQRLAPSERRIAGNGRIISAWPVRTGVLCEDGKGYACAGVFPSQGVYQVTLDLKTGRIEETTALDVSAQGYLARLGGKLHVPTGRDPAGAFLDKLKRRGKEIGREARSIPDEYGYAFIGAGDARFGGGEGKIAAFGTSDAKLLWSAKVEGKAYSLAFARGRLYASTDQGCIYCFGPKRVEAPPAHEPDAVESAREELLQGCEVELARKLFSEAGTEKGYTLILGAGDAKLAMGFALASPDMQVIVREPDPKKVDELRRRIAELGLTDQISVHHGSLEKLPYGEYLFNLILNGDLHSEEVRRLLRPGGGLAMSNSLEKYHRAALRGAGEWTHQYGNPSNTSCSSDQHVKGKLGLLWFGRPGPRPMVDRHHRTAAPLFKDGRLFIPGENRVIAMDGYNGTILWDRSMPGSMRVAVLRDSSYLAVDENHLFIAERDRCVALHPQTGKTEVVHELPESVEEREWGYLAVVEGTLLGSTTKPGSSRRTQSHQVVMKETYWDFVPVVCSDSVFARDAKSGKLRWTYRTKGGLIPNPTFAATEEAVFFIESKNKATSGSKLSRAPLSDLLGGGSELVSLDLKSGRERWRVEVPLEKLRHNVYVSLAEGIVLIAGSRNSGTDKKTSTVLFDVHALDARDGKLLWSRTQDQKMKIGGDHGEQDHHPVIVGEKIYLEPFAYDLKTGEPIDWQWPYRNGKRRGCGALSASAGSFFFRDQNLTMFDLESRKASKVTTTTRPGCWINLLPAGGLLLAPEASSGCSCDFAVQTSLGLIPVPDSGP